LEDQNVRAGAACVHQLDAVGHERGAGGAAEIAGVD
jgi:hypothetical protein